MKFYQLGSKWILGAYTLDAGTCYKIESDNGERIEIKTFTDHRTLAYEKYVSFTNAAGTAYTKDEVNALLNVFLKPDNGVVGGCIAVTPHDENLLPHVGWFEVRGNAGNVAFVDEYGNAPLVLAFDQKEISRCRVSQILATGTTATNIYLYY